MNTTLTIAKTETIIGSFKIELDLNQDNLPTAKYGKLITKGPKKGTYKIIENYRFKSEEQRQQYVIECTNRINKIVAEEVARENAKAAARANFVNPYSVGQLLYNSWGYEQTNIDFYQVIAIGKKTVTVRPIADRVVSEGKGDYGYKKPVADAFTGESIDKKVQFYLDGKNEAVYYLNSKFGSLSNYQETEKGVYYSYGY